MIIDILYAILLVYAIFRGWTKGFVIAVFSVIALLAGLTAALKLSAALAIYLEKIGHFHSGWLPVLTFLIVFLGIAVLVRLCAKTIEKILQIAMLGWINRLLGIILYAFIYTVIFSVLLWLGNQLYFITPGMKVASNVYPRVAPLGPEIIDGMGKWIPVCKNIFNELEVFFAKTAQSLSR